MLHDSYTDSVYGYKLTLLAPLMHVPFNTVLPLGGWGFLQWPTGPSSVPWYTTKSLEAQPQPRDKKRATPPEKGDIHLLNTNLAISSHQVSTISLKHESAPT
jgi:hypothetical protein